MKPSPAINGRFYSSAGEPATGAQGCLTNVANVGAQAPEGDEQVHHLRDHVGRMSAANLAHQLVSVDVVTVPWPRFRGVLCLIPAAKGKSYMPQGSHNRKAPRRAAEKRDLRRVPRGPDRLVCQAQTQYIG